MVTARRPKTRPLEQIVVEGNKAPAAYPPFRPALDGHIARPVAEAMPTPLLSFDGLSNCDNIAVYSAVIMPPDMTGDVGPIHYVQVVNALVRVFDKNGNTVTPPFKMSELFAPLGTPCSSRNDGEATVLYDHLADRWLLSKYCTLSPPFRQMIAISKTGDPTGEYYLYEFVMPNIRLNDLAKFGVWPDGYYMSTEEYTGSDFSGTGMFAFDRLRMLEGDPAASYIYFSRSSRSAERLGNILPSDLDGLNTPPAGMPNIFAGYTATEYGDERDALLLFDFHADFAVPANSTFIERVESPVAVAAFDPTSPPGRADISQPPPGERLDSNSDRLSYRVSYRNMDGGGSIVLNQTVRTGQDPYRAGVRLYRLKESGGEFQVEEQVTVGDTSASRWIGSAAQDNAGNLAVGYNYATDADPPSLRFTGRLSTEPPGTLRDEGVLVNGTGVQRAFGWRWGDYSGMSVDPVDDCTFWMTGEYYTLASQQFSDFTWLTRVGAFRFPECKDVPRAMITGTVKDASTGLPIRGARVQAEAYSRSSAPDGSYGSMNVLPGTYSVTASAPGYREQSVAVTAQDHQMVVRDFELMPRPVFATPVVALSAEGCPSGAPGPGDPVMVNITLQNAGRRDAADLIARLLPGHGVTLPGPEQSYGAMPADGPPVTREFTFTVDPTLACGQAMSLRFAIRDGGEDLGTLEASIRTGKPRVVFQQNFDRSHQAQLPPRWTRSVTGGAQNWTVSAARASSGNKSAFSPDPIYAGVNEMISPVFAVHTTDAALSFRNWYDLETTFLRNRLYDGAVLEIRIGSGAWQDIIAAGGTFVTGGYDGLIDGCCQNPLAGRFGWSGRSGVNATAEFITSSLKLPPSAAGQPVQLRWRVGSDVGGFREGQYIDDVLVTDGFICGCNAARTAPSTAIW
jgi:hypothetical protein